MKSLNPFKESAYVKVDNKNRFYFMLQQMQSNRWKITSLVLFLFFFIIFGINMAVMFEVQIAENWKEMLLILLGAFVGNLNKVVDYWFNSEDRDKMLIQKVDEEDGGSLSSVLEFIPSKKPEVPVAVTEPIVSTPQVQSPVEELSEEVVEEIVPSVEESIEPYSVEDLPSESNDSETPLEGESESESK
jgi:hypothetical protein